MVQSQNKTWIMVSVLTVVLLLAGALFYYFYFYLKSNFGDKELNNVTQSGNGTVNPGSYITYNINYKNSGNTAVKNLIISAPIPENTAFSSTTYNNCDMPASGNKIIEFRIGNLNKNEGGSISYTVKVSDPADNGNKIKNDNILFIYETAGKKIIYKIPDRIESKIKSSPVFKEFGITLFDENGGNINEGDKVIFTINLGNSGNMNAQNIKVIDMVSSKLNVIEKSISSSGRYDPFTKKILWNLDSLNKNSTAKLQFEAVIGNDFNNLENFKNIAQLDYSQAGGLNIKNEASLEAAVYGLPDLSSSIVTVSAANDKDIWAWELIKYTIQVKNTGKADALNIKVNCPIPPGTGYQGDSASDKTAIWNQEKSLLQFKIDKIKPGEQKTFTFRAVVAGYFTGGGEIEAKFNIEGDGIKVEMPPAIAEVNPYIFQTVVCMGDSLVSLENWPRLLKDLLDKTYVHANFNLIATGVKGEMAVDAIKRFDEDVRIHNPQIIILGYGSNDAGGSLAFFRYHMDILIKQAKSTGAKVFVYGTGYIDTSGRWKGKADYRTYNDILKNDLCPSNGAVYIDIYAPMSADPKKYLRCDGLHWNQAGSDLVANTIFRTIIEYLDGNGKIK
ncbi:MAG: GDSL-type esterase/lipase family protein [Actinobacteria bacterium]|nr:GDSL-type esterase/lipase family protein [Actinomycetota bacterium]